MSSFENLSYQRTFPNLPAFDILMLRKREDEKNVHFFDDDRIVLFSFGRR